MAQLVPFSVQPPESYGMICKYCCTEQNQKPYNARSHELKYHTPVGEGDGIAVEVAIGLIAVVTVGTMLEAEEAAVEDGVICAVQQVCTRQSMSK